MRQKAHNYVSCVVKVDIIIEPYDNVPTVLYRVCKLHQNIAKARAAVAIVTGRTVRAPRSSYK